MRVALPPDELAVALAQRQQRAREPVEHRERRVGLQRGGRKLADDGRAQRAARGEGGGLEELLPVALAAQVLLERVRERRRQADHQLARLGRRAVERLGRRRQPHEAARACVHAVPEGARLPEAVVGLRGAEGQQQADDRADRLVRQRRDGRRLDDRGPVLGEHARARGAKRNAHGDRQRRRRQQMTGDARQHTRRGCAQNVREPRFRAAVPIDAGSAVEEAVVRAPRARWRGEPGRDGALQHAPARRDGALQRAPARP